MGISEFLSLGITTSLIYPVYFDLVYSVSLFYFRICAPECPFIKRTCQNFEPLIVMVSWYNEIIIFSVTSKALLFCIWIFFLPRNYITIIILVLFAAQGCIYLISRWFHFLWPFENDHIPHRYISLWNWVSYCCSLWRRTF